MRRGKKNDIGFTFDKYFCLQVHGGVKFETVPFCVGPVCRNFSQVSSRRIQRNSSMRKNVTADKWHCVVFELIAAFRDALSLCLSTTGKLVSKTDIQ